MGHLSHQKAYLDLRRRMRQTPLGFPHVPAVEEVLRLLFRPEEAEVVARLPRVPMTARRIARRLGRPERKVVPLLDGMAERGLILGLHVTEGMELGGAIEATATEAGHRPRTPVQVPRVVVIDQGAAG